MGVVDRRKATWLHPKLEVGVFHTLQPTQVGSDISNSMSSLWSRSSSSPWSSAELSCWTPLATMMLWSFVVKHHCHMAENNLSRDIKWPLVCMQLAACAIPGLSKRSAIPGLCKHSAIHGLPAQSVDPCFAQQAQSTDCTNPCFAPKIYTITYGTCTYSHAGTNRMVLSLRVAANL